MCGYAQEVGKEGGRERETEREKVRERERGTQLSNMLLIFFYLSYSSYLCKDCLRIM
jgi:hypothetical protein